MVYTYLIVDIDHYVVSSTRHFGVRWGALQSAGLDLCIADSSSCPLGEASAKTGIR
jgi:hypothetical protein